MLVAVLVDVAVGVSVVVLVGVNVGVLVDVGVSVSVAVGVGEILTCCNVRHSSPPSRTFEVPT